MTARQPIHLLPEEDSEVLGVMTEVNRQTKKLLAM